MKMHVDWLKGIVLTGLIAACTPTTGSEKGTERMTATDEQVLLKLILDYPDLQPYLHPEVDGRVPVRVKGAGALGAEAPIEKFGKPVEFVTGNQASENGAPILDIVSLVIEGESARFELRYEIEGVIMTGSARKSGNQWSIAEYEIVES